MKICAKRVAAMTTFPTTDNSRTHRGWPPDKIREVSSYEKEAAEPNALTAVIVSIAGLDKGFQYWQFSRQLYEIHKVATEPWNDVWQRYVEHAIQKADGIPESSE